MKVLHVNVVVEYINDPESDNCGTYVDQPTPTITINTSYDLQTQARTKIHEYFHALIGMVTDANEPLSEEAAARLFELGVVDLARQNWKELEALRGEG